MREQYHKYDWLKIDEYIIGNPSLTNREVGEKFGAPLSTISGRRSFLGLRKMELQLWTPVQVKWLKSLYQIMGDYEIALIFSEAYPKAKGWTLKHIEKKRLLLGLKRTPEQLKTIRRRNYLNGSWMMNINRMHEQRKHPDGTVKKWGKYTYIKSGEKFERIMRHTWEKENGPIPEGFCVVRKDRNKPENDLENLELIDRGILAQRNKLSMYPYELKNTIITLSQLNKTINEKHK